MAREGIENTKKKVREEAMRQIRRAAEIFQEEAEKVVLDMRQNSVWTGGLSDADINVTQAIRRRGGKDGLFNMSMTITILDNVYNILDEGVSYVPRYASDYGLKAFPMAFPRSPKEELSNEHMTTPNSLEFQPARVVEKTLFRPVIRTPIKPRNFTKQIAERTRDRIADEGLQVKFTYKKDKGGDDGE